MKKEMTWEEWYYKYYPRVAKMLTAAFLLAVVDAILLLFLLVALGLGWV
ncbi:MAG: hypothetical protein J7L58_03700 [Thermoplasmata archaeon]|nr:hypothetical protein [Thermoplasmata archaeon]